MYDDLSNLTIFESKPWQEVDLIAELRLCLTSPKVGPAT